MRIPNFEKIGEWGIIPRMKSAPPNFARVAVIDIGSNASRLLLARGGADADGAGIAVEMFARAPMRLGAEAFGPDQKISPLTVGRLALTLLGFQNIIAAQEPDSWRAFATAAMREAINGEAVAKYLRQKAGIPLQILSGQDEARIVGQYVAAQFPNAPAIVAADIGGGTSDLVFAQNGRIKSAASFKIGTNRANSQALPREFARMEKWLASKRPNKPTVAVVGSAAAQAEQLCGGLSAPKMKKWRREISKLPPETVAARFGMEPDRAESANAAVSLYQFLLESSGAAKLQVVKGGLPQALASDLMRCELRKRRRKKGAQQK